MMTQVIGWICVAFCLSMIGLAQLIYWFDNNKSKLWLDRVMERDGQPVPKRGGFWWCLFLWLHRRLNK
jgi:hypothetical protein